MSIISHVAFTRNTKTAIYAVISTFYKNFQNFKICLFHVKSFDFDVFSRMTHSNFAFSSLNCDFRNFEKVKILPLRSLIRLVDDAGILKSAFLRSLSATNQ